MNDDGDMFWPENMKMVGIDNQTLEMHYIDFPYPKGFNEVTLSEQVKLCQTSLYLRNFPVSYENERVTFSDYLNYCINNDGR